MFEKIKHYFDKHISLAETNGAIEDKLEVASAALLMEVMHTERTFELEKQNLILVMLERTFSLSEEQAASLMEIAEHKRQQATDYYEFTHLICNEFTHGQKIQLIESLWKIAFVDDTLNVETEYLVDKVARLLFIPHAELLATRNRVKAG